MDFCSGWPNFLILILWTLHKRLQPLLMVVPVQPETRQGVPLRCGAVCLLAIDFFLEG
jgi:hypothetical protein